MTTRENIPVHSPTHCPQCNRPLADPPPNFCPHCGYSLLAAVPSTSGSSQGAFGPAPGYRPNGHTAYPMEQREPDQREDPRIQRPGIEPSMPKARHSPTPRRQQVSPTLRKETAHRVLRPPVRSLPAIFVLAIAILVVTAVISARLATLSPVSRSNTASQQHAPTSATRGPSVAQIATGLKELSQHCGGISLLQASNMVQSGLQDLRKNGDTGETDLSLLNAYNLALRADGGRWGKGCNHVVDTLISLTLHPRG